jgi:hypothetical protein
MESLAIDKSLVIDKIVVLLTKKDVGYIHFYQNVDVVMPLYCVTKEENLHHCVIQLFSNRYMLVDKEGKDPIETEKLNFIKIQTLSVLAGTSQPVTS